MAVIIGVAGWNVVTSIRLCNHVVDGNVVTPRTGARCWAYFNPVAYISVYEIRPVDRFRGDLRRDARKDMRGWGNQAHRDHGEKYVECQQTGKEETSHLW